MGRAFEFRKERKFKRWDKMSKAFTRIGKEIAIAVKTGGPLAENNPRLRAAMQTAKGVNMPKDRVENAIKRAMGKDAADFQELLYEGKGPHNVALMVETATDNPTRTVANVRMHFNKTGGTMGVSGSLSFMFERKGIFKLAAEGLDPEELELELIDYGLEELRPIVEEAEDGTETRIMEIITSFESYGAMSKALEDRSLPVTGNELVRLPTTLVELSDAEIEDVYKLIERLEEDEDVQRVYHNMKED